VAEKDGRLWRLANGRHTSVLDLHRVVRSGHTEFDEDGLLSVAFAHDFTTSGHLYVYYTRRPDGAGVVRRYTMRAGAIVPASGRNIIVVPMAPPAPAEAGGTVWTTSDGMVWLAAGDGGTQGLKPYAQDLSRLQGKILRVIPGVNGGHTVPADNPYVGRAGAREEIWALGLRQPWRVQLDAPTGDLWVTDVGQATREEINVLRGGTGAGSNFGWPRIEGNRLIHQNVPLTLGTPYMAPFVTWDHTSKDDCHAVMGGGVYRGPVTSLQGWYVYANLCGRTVTALDPATRRKVDLPGVMGIDTFGTGRNGEMYAASVFNGRIYRIVAK
jgi:glucose/arabinose dehydrogenase